MEKVPEFPLLRKSVVQASLPPGLVPVGDNTLLSGTSTSCAVFLAACQSVFQERLVHHLARVVPADTVKEVLSVGTIQVLSVVSLQQMMTVIRTYSSAVTEVFVCATRILWAQPGLILVSFLAAIGAVPSFLFNCCTMWTSLGNVSRKRKRKRRAGRQLRFYFVDL